MLKQKIHTWNPFFWLWFLFTKIYTIIHGSPNSPPSPPTISEYASKYTKKQHHHFTKALATKSNYNTNMDACLYNRKECTELMLDPENELEKKWKSRILFETSPRGNIIMHYNPFKNAFAYYCDNASLPYTILNAVVMKYVVVYRCIDLFIDEHITQEPSPLIQIIKDYEKEQDKKPETEKIALPKSKAFAKFKNYSKPATTTDETKKSESTTPKMINSIVYMGKIANFSFIQKSSKKKSIGFRSKLLEGLDSQTKITSWRNFKKQTQTPPESKPLHEEIQEFMEKTELINDAINAAIENITQNQDL